MVKKKIIDKVLEKKTVMATTPGTADSNKDLAIAAIIGGIKSPAWRTYMEQFVDGGDSDQLMRLLATDGTDNDKTQREHRAYLLTNATCGETTKGLFDTNVESIDQDLPGVTNCKQTPAAPSE